MYGIFSGLESIGLSFGELPFSSFYVGMVCAISSTMIVVKLLSEKCETDTMPGRLTVGILIFQDIWAIIVLAIQPNLDSPEIVGIAKQFGMIAVLIAISLTYAKFVMPAVLFYASKSVELMLVLSLGWCFFIGCIAIQPYIGLSMELASLIAGVALATFPYSAEFNGKIKYIRDFFITLFFAGLGMQIPVPTPIPILKAFLVAFVVVLIRPLGIFCIVCILGGGAQLGAIATINLSQISEFALVICSLGMPLGHVKEDTLTIIIWTFAILAISASYLIGANAAIYRAVASRVRRMCGRAPLEDSNGQQDTINFSFEAVNLDFGMLEHKIALKTAFEASMKESILEVVNPAKEGNVRVTLSSGISDNGTGTQVEVSISCNKARTKAIEASIAPEMSGKMTLALKNSGMDEASLGDLSVASMSEPEVIESEDGHGHQDIILLGFHRIAFMLIAEFQAKSPDMLQHLHVIDVNQSIMPALRKKGVKCTYGDICAPDVLEHCHHGEPRLVLCTIPDSLLQGVTNAKLLKIAQEVWPSAHYIVTADNPQQANMLYQQGAHYVLRSAKLCAERLQDLLTKHRKSMTSAESELAHLFNSYRAKDKDKRTSFIQQKLHGR
jgi:Kef-type K+ transport system membrane component KefB